MRQIAVAILILIAWSAFAATDAVLNLTVTTTKDSVDRHPGDGVCADKKGLCSLRAAMSCCLAGMTLTCVLP